MGWKWRATFRDLTVRSSGHPDRLLDRLSTDLEKVFAELRRPFAKVGEAGLEGGEVFEGGGGVGGPGGVEGAEFREGCIVRLGKPVEGEIEHLAQRELFSGEQRAAERTRGGGLLFAKALEIAAQGGEFHEKLTERGRDRRGGGGAPRRGQFEKMAQAGRGVAENGVRSIERCKWDLAPAWGIRVLPGGGALKAFPQRLDIEPETVRLCEDDKVIGHVSGVRAVRAVGARGNFRRRAEMHLARAAGLRYARALPAL